MTHGHRSGPVRRLARPRAARPSPRPSPWWCSSPTSSSRRPASRCWGGSRRGPRARRALPAPLLGGDRRTFCLPADPDVCSYVADPFTLVIQFLVLGGALLTALLSIDTLKDHDLPERRVLVPAAVLGLRRGPAARLPGPRHPRHRPRSRLVARLRAGRTAARGPALLRGRAQVLPVLGGRHRRDAARRELPVRGHRQPAPRPVATRLTALPDPGWPPWRAPASRSPSSASPSRPPPPRSTSGCRTPTSGAPLPIAAYLSVVGKAVGFSGLILVTVRASPVRERLGPGAGRTRRADHDRRQCRAPCASDRRRAHSAVRLLAWSSVGQAGYLLVPIAAAGYADDPAHAIGSTVAYALMYAAVNLGAFAVAALVARTRPANRITDYRGLYAPRPARGARPRLLPALPGRSAARHHRPVRQGHGLLRGRRRGPGLARGDHGGQRRDRALLLPPVDGGPLPRPEGPRSGRGRRRTAAEAAGGARPAPGPGAARRRHRLATVLGIALSGAPQLVLRFASGALALSGAPQLVARTPPGPHRRRPQPVRHHAPPGAAVCPARPTARAQGNQPRSSRVDQ